MFVDIVEYTALMEQNEQTALALLNRFKSVPEKITPKNEGRIIQYFGEGCLPAFDRTFKSIDCAIALLKSFSESRDLSSCQNQSMTR
jgi:class 3 adenylate cyclase